MSGELSRPRAEGVLKALQALYKAQGLYPPGHTAVQRAREAVGQVLAPVLSQPDPLLVGLADGFLVVGGAAFVEGNAQAQELARRLEARRVEGFLVDRGATSEEVGRFLAWLRSSEPVGWQGFGISLTDLSRTDVQWRKALRLHGAAIHAIREADRDLREGRIPDPRQGRECVAAFSELLDENPSLLRGLLLIKDYDHYTFYHSVNVSLLSLGIGRQMGLAAEELDCLGVGGLFHDIGKTRTPVDVIRKPGRLSTDEFAVVQWHPVHGREILAQMGGFPEPSVRVVHEHHMSFDGGGYPSRGGSPALHPLTPIVTVADVYDAMTTHRPYSLPQPLPAAIQAMARLRGTTLSPEVFDAFLSLVGVTPVGSVLRLSTGEVAVATKVGSGGHVSQVMVVAGPDGKGLTGDGRSHRAVCPGDVAGWVATFSRQMDLCEAVRSQL